MVLDILASDPAAGDDDVDLSKLEIDEKYARRLEHNKKREALHRLQELKKQGRAGSDDSDSDSDSSSDEEPDADDPSELAKFARGLVTIKEKIEKQEPDLKQPDFKLFDDDDEDEDDEEDVPAAARKAKPLYLKDVNAKHLLEEGPEFDDNDNEPLKHGAKIYKKEQADSIRAFLEAEKDALGSSEEDEFLKQKETGGGKGDADDGATAELQEHLDQFFDGAEENENEKFLKEYLLDRKWVDRGKDKNVLSDVDVSEDEDALDKQDEYEARYNFRYQEAGQEDRVLGHSRTMEGSVRKKTNSRKVQRKNKEERMAQAEFERKEELKHLKNLKKKEIQERLDRVRAIAGIGKGGTCKLDEDDLEEDFDPNEYDKKMKQMFGDDYYGAEDADPEFGSDGEDDLEKPDFDKEDELLGLPKDWDVCESKGGFEAVREKVLKQKQKEKEEVAEEEEDDDDDNDDDDDDDDDVGDEESEDEPSVETQKEEGKRKRKRKVPLREKVELDKELEEYYKLDYEGTIGDLKTRFKYTSVQPRKYGLHAADILMAEDKNLNQYVSIKKLAPYIDDEWKVKKDLKRKKHLILQVDYENMSKKKKIRGGRKSSSDAEMKQNNEANGTSRNSRRRRQKAELKPSLTRLKAYGAEPSKPQKKRQKKH